MAERAKANRGAKRARARKSNGKSAPEPKSIGSVPDEVFQRWALKARTAHGAYKRAAETARQKKGELGQIYEAMDREGVDRKGMKKFIADMDGDAQEIAQVERVRVKLHRLNDTPLHQLNLFDERGPAPVSPYLQGQKDGREGRACESPYVLGTPQAEQYTDGWNDGQHKHHESLRQASEAAAAP